MKTTEMKQIVDSQRYYLTAVMCTLNYIEDQHLKILAQENIERIWVLTELLNSSFNLKAKSFDEIVKHGKEIEALNKMYDQEYDKTKLN